MARNPEYQFVPTDPEEITALLIKAFELIVGTTVYPDSKVRLFIQWLTYAFVQERVQTNYTGNQNIPSRAEGKNLDGLSELTYIRERPPAKAATCTMRFYISEAQKFPVLIPAGTRISNADKTLIWATPKDAYVPIGETCVDVENVTCQTLGTVGNGYTKGQLTKLVDVYDYYTKCENITVSGGGSDVPNDDEYYELMRASMDAYSDAGAGGAYIYFAKKAAPTEIADVVANSPVPGEVKIYVLMKDGTLAGDEMKKKVLAECKPDGVRPLTDLVSTADAELVDYDINLTYYLTNGSQQSAAKTAEKVRVAVDEYIAWQSAKLGRDINPSKLYHLLMETGIKRIDIRSPVFTSLRDGNLMLGDYMQYDQSLAVPQVAKLGRVTITDGGYEDE